MRESGEVQVDITDIGASDFAGVGPGYKVL